MVQSGNLKQIPLAELFQSCSISRKSGVLRILNRDFTYQLCIFKGALVGITTSEPARKIGQYLISRGYLKEGQLRVALEEQEIRGDRRLGEILQAHGVVSPEQMEKAVRQRAQEIVADLFLLEEAVFQFDDRSVFPSELIELDLNLDHLVLEGLRRREEWARIRRVLVGDGVRLRARPIEKSPSNSLTKFQAGLLTLLKQEKTIGELVINSRRSAFEVYLELYRLLEAGRLEIVSAISARVSTPVVLDLKQLQEEIHALARGRDYARAWERLDGLRGQVSAPPWLDELQKWLEEEEAKYLQERYVDPAVPALAVNIREIRREELDPKEGFLLSRLGEGMNMKTLCQVMPLNRREIFRLLFALERRGIIRL
jgi:hypothetical protein